MLQHLKQSQSRHSDILEKLDRLLSNQQGIGSSAISYITTVMRDAPEGLDRELQDALVDVVYTSEAMVQDDRRLESPVVSTAREQALTTSILSALEYDGMLDRESTVTAAHETTFEWVFCPEEGQIWSDFPAWLRSSDQLYWITGKAGSGKSTLIKFISQPPAETAGDPRCMDSLRIWAGDRPITVASFYFWASGKQTQCSALLRTLLYQLLSAYPDTIKVVSPAHWAAGCLFDGKDSLKPFSDRDLEEMLVKTVRHLDKLGCALCLFVDGLDEFEGDPKLLIRVLRCIINDTRTKLCVSSRPWQHFEDSFGSGPSLRVEDLTLRDIEKFIADQFMADANFSRVRSLEPVYAAQLVSEVAKKSSGVFLWVHLVVTSLLDGMRDGDTISELQRRLDELSPDLEQLYDRILGADPNPSHLRKLAQYMKLVDSALEPLPLLLLSFADEDDPEFAIKSKMIVNGQLDQEVMAARLGHTERRVKSRSRGLLEVTRGPRYLNASGRVQYYHKTVKDYVQDYIRRPSTQGAFATELRGTAFDPYLSLAAASLAMYKLAGNEPKDLVFGLFYASRVTDARLPDMIRIVDEFGASWAQHLRNSTRTPGELRESISHFVTKSLNFTNPAPLWLDLYTAPDHFISLATQCGVVEYVRHKITTPFLDEAGDPVCPSINRWQFMQSITAIGERWRRTGTIKGPWPLLFDAAFPLSPWPTCGVSMVGMLLDKGADPNLQMGSFGSRATKSKYTWLSLNPSHEERTVWSRALLNLLKELPDNHSTLERKLMWGEIAQLMVKRRADRNRGLIERTVASLGSQRWSIGGLTESQLVDGLEESLDKAKRGRGFELGVHFELSKDPPLQDPPLPGLKRQDTFQQRILRRLSWRPS